MIQDGKPSGQNRLKNSLKECVYVNSAHKIQCHIVKKYTPMQTAFTVILPTANVQLQIGTVGIVIVVVCHHSKKVPLCGLQPTRIIAVE